MDHHKKQTQTHKSREDTSRSITINESEVNIKSMYQEDLKTPEIEQVDQSKFVNAHGLIQNRKNDHQTSIGNTDDQTILSQNIITNQRYGTRPGDSIDMGISDISRRYGKPVLDGQSQTDPSVYIRFACNLFLNEIIEAIKEEKEMREQNDFNDLLKKAEHIVNRIKSKAVGSNGIFIPGMAAMGSAAYGAGVSLNLPMTPING